MHFRALVLLSVGSWSLAALADHRVLMVVPPPAAAQAGDSVSLEARLGRSPDVTLLSYRAQLEITEGSRVGKATLAPAAAALQMAKFGGADAVVFGPLEALQVCQSKSGECKAVGAKDPAKAAEAILKEVGVAPAAAEASGDETRSAPARAAYARCRGILSAALQQSAKAHKVTRGFDKDCQAAVSADPKYLPALAARAVALELAGDPKAEAALKDALKKRPADPLVPAALADLHRANPNLDLRPVVLEAEAAAPTSVDLPQARAEMNFNSDDFRAAMAAFEKALEVAPNSAYLHWRLSYAAYVSGDVPKSLVHAERASRLAGGEHALFQAEYASRLIDAEQYAPAQALLEPLRKADPTWGRVALRYGFALHKQGKSKEALPHLETALKAPPRSARERDDHDLAAMDIARAHAVLGESDAAFGALEGLQKAGRLEAIALKDADFNSLRADPRFAKLSAPQ